MDFFNDLLNSYTLLKKRSLKVRLVEQDENISYFKLPEDDAAITQTNTTLLAVFGPQIDPASKKSQTVTEVDVGADPLNLLQAAGETESTSSKEGETSGGESASCGGTIYLTGSKIPVVKKDCTTHAQEFGKYRNLLVRSYVSGELSSEGAGENTPEMQEVLGLSQAYELQNLGGPSLIGALADLFRVAPRLGISELMKAKGTANWRTIPVKIYNSLVGKAGVDLATEEDVFMGVVTKYERPPTPYVIDATANLSKVLNIIDKFNHQRSLFTYQDAEFVKNNIIISKYKSGHHEHFKIFVKANELDELGITFDWEMRKKKKAHPDDPDEKELSPLQETLETFQQSLLTWGEGKGFSEDDLKIPEADRSDFALQGKATPQKIITEVSESMDTIAVLLMQNNYKGATKLYRRLLDNFGTDIMKALKLNDQVNYGELIGTEETEILGESLQLMEEHFGGVEDAESIQQTFHALVSSVLRHRVSDMKSMNPDMVMRVGSRSGAGGEGAKKDQLLIYRDLENAEAHNTTGKPIITAPLSEILTPEELKTAQKLYGLSKDDLSSEVHVTTDSLKWTMDSARTNLGSTASILNVTSDFATGDSDYVRTLFKAQGLSKKSQASVMDKFNDIKDSIDSLNSMFDPNTGSTTQNARETARTFLTSIGPEAAKSLGLTQEVLNKSLVEINKSGDTGDKSSLVTALKQKIENRLLLNQIQSGSQSSDPEESAAWRGVATSYLMRGCYDSDNSDFVVQNYLTGERFRYNGNKYLTKAMKKYIKTGEGLNITDSGFSISGYSANFAMSKTGRNSMKMTGPVHGKSIKDSLEYSPTEIMNKLLEVQQLMFTHLIKE